MLAGLIFAAGLGAAASAVQPYPAPSERMEDMQRLCQEFPSIVQLDGALLGCVADNDDATIETFQAVTDDHVRYVYVARLKTEEDPVGSPILLVIDPANAAGRNPDG